MSETTEPQTFLKYAHPKVQIVYENNKGDISTVETRVSVAYYQTGTNIEMATAFCAPVDNFDRKKGAQIAKARLENHWRTTKFELWSETNQFEDIMATIITGSLPCRWQSIALVVPDAAEISA